MAEKVLLVLVDGLRPDAIDACGEEYLKELARKGASAMDCRTVMPSVTLPCHASLFLSVDPQRHGILTNDWRPLVRPIESIADAVHRYDKTAAFFYNWEQLRDLARPGSLERSFYTRIARVPSPEADRIVTAQAIEAVRQIAPDFVFVYLGVTDETGHRFGWMSPEYLCAVREASLCIKQMAQILPEEYQLIVTADHGGHSRGHGEDIAEDMTIPLILSGSRFAPRTVENAQIIDIAPTVAALLHIKPPAEWEGKSLL